MLSYKYQRECKMAGKTNTQQACVVSETQLKSAPSLFKDNDGIIIPKTEAEYNERG